jgi:hypothetical protein
MALTVMTFVAASSLRAALIQTCDMHGADQIGYFTAVVFLASVDGEADEGSRTKRCRSLPNNVP